MAANHRLVEMKKAPSGDYSYHIKKGRNILNEGHGYNDKRSIVKMIVHLFGLNERQARAFTAYDRIDIDNVNIPQDEATAKVKLGKLFPEGHPVDAPIP